MVLDVAEVHIIVFDPSAGATAFIVAFLGLAHLLADSVEILLVLLDLFANEVAFTSVGRILLTLHEIHRLNLHLLEQILRLTVLLRILLRFEIDFQARLIFQKEAHIVHGVDELFFVTIDQIQ